MSDPRLRDPILPPASERPYGTQPSPLDRDYVAAPVRTTSGGMWGFLAVVAILILGGLFYYSTRTPVDSATLPPPASTTGVAPQPDTRPVAPAPLPPPAVPRQVQ
jgi:hypothetical protein